MRRRQFIAVAAGVASWPLVGRAQQGAIHRDKPYRIGFLFAGTLSLRPQAQAFWQALRQIGYRLGENSIAEMREARGETNRLPALASDIVATHPDVIVAVTSPAVLAAKNATKTIPIVMAITSNPVGSGIVNDLARPEANITGPSLLMLELTEKRVQLMREMAPELSTLGILWNERAANNESAFQLAAKAATSLGIAVRSFPVRVPDDLKTLPERASEEPVGAIFVASDALLFDRRSDIIAFSLAKHVPTFHTLPEEAIDGAVAAYGADLTDEYRRAAFYVHKILAGAAPADLPVEQSTRFRFVLNMKTAKAIGMSIPRLIWLRADQVIE
jgi:putative ABC transport system substrate-binding protein